MIKSKTMFKLMDRLKRYRWLLYRGSTTVWLVLGAISNLYKILFPRLNYVILPTIWGARLVLPKYGFSEGRYITIMLGVVEPQWKNLFIKYISRAKVFLDVGAAADGYYSLLACKLNPNIKVLAIEPLRNEYKYLVRNIEINNMLGKIIAINIALCEENKTIKINGHEVKCVKLDELFSTMNLPSIDVIKLDVEGAGYKVLRGGIKTILKYKPVIFFEVHNSMERKAIRELKKLGYKIIKEYGEMYIAIPHNKN